MITGYELIEKMYSDNYSEYEDTRLYSTGDDELDDLLERAFCEGYEYAQREYADSLKDAIKEALKNGDEDELKRLRKGVTRKGTAAGGIAGTGLVGAGMSRFIDKHNDEIRNSSPELKHTNDNLYKSAVGVTKGVFAAGGGVLGAASGFGAARIRYNKALKKAKEELEKESGKK